MQYADFILPGETPDFLAAFCRTPELQRLKRVGMNCGCEYTRFPIFRDLKPYSRYDHSLACSLLVWRFTGDVAQTVAALFHDIASPAFAHAIDFMHKDYLIQESTEARTGEIIRGSRDIMQLLKQYGLTAGDVEDYHRYPIADNDSPRLSADRLEYTLGNLENYGYRGPDALAAYCDGLLVWENEDGAPELAFARLDVARDFAMDALKCSRIYVSAEARYAMQMLAEVVAGAIAAGVLTEEDLYRTEPEVIALLESNPDSRAAWRRYQEYRAIVPDGPAGARRVIPAKKRNIDPLVHRQGRLSALCPEFREARDAFLQTPQDAPICAV